MELDFKAIDFQGVCGEVRIPLGTDLTPLADHVNKLLRERLDKAQLLFLSEFDFEQGGPNMMAWTGKEEAFHPSHTGRIVCVEGIK